MSAEKRVDWFDLSRFGVALRVLPESPLRGPALTCFEVRDQDVYGTSLGLTAEASQERRREIREGLSAALEGLEFNPTPTYVIGDQGTPVTRFYSGRQTLSFTDIRRLVPDAEVTDLRQMSVAEIAIRPTPQDQSTEAWKGFIDSVLSRDAKGVWVRKQNPFDVPWKDAGSILAVRPGQGQRNRLIDRVFNSFIDDKLHKAGYRQNALVAYYVDLTTAEADGLKTEELEQVDLPYAAPLYVTRNHQVIAVRDVRFAPEALALHPEMVYGEPKGGVVVEPLRAALALRPLLARAVAQWKTWGDAPESVTEPDFLWASVTEVVSALGELGWDHNMLRPVSNRLTDGLHESRNGQYRAIPLSQLSPVLISSLVDDVNQILSLERAECDAIERALAVVVERDKVLRAEAVRESARALLQDVAQTSRAAVVSERSEKWRIEDVGVKIGGARKDFAKRAMIAADLGTMNDMEREALVQKNNVWPALDYPAMKERGVSLHAAMGIKLVKDALAMRPAYGRHVGPEAKLEAAATYIEAIGLVRDALAPVKSLEDLGNALRDLRERGQDGQPNMIYGTRIQWQWGRNVACLVHDWHYGLPRMLKHKVERKVGTTIEGEGDWGVLIKKGALVPEDVRADRKKKAELEEQLHRPHLDKVRREGNDWRQGRDVAGEDFLQHFGFRAVEFGEWLPQDERQLVLNHAWDALMDLAQALELPPHGLSLDGTLAIAFGSRGQGGKRAAMAHYEPARVVINLTRMKGAGSLAHEWWHALDMYLSGAKEYASEMTRGDAMGVLSNRLRRREATVEELEHTANANIEKLPKYATSWLRAPGVPEELFLPTIHRDIAELRESLLERASGFIEANKDNPRFSELGFTELGPFESSELMERAEKTVEALIDLHPRGRLNSTELNGASSNLRALVRNLAVACTIEALRTAGVPAPISFVGGRNAVKSKFMLDAEALDKQRSTPYWATTRELLARAGAAYVYDRLAIDGVRSDHLVFGSEENRYADHPLGNPNPTGADRERLAPHFASLLEEYRLRCVKEKAVEHDTADLEM